VDANAFVDDLAAARIGATFNQYADGDRAGLLRGRLVEYLEARANTSLVLVGEAAGYRGARVSGIPFTSERQLTGAGPAEATATVVNRVLGELGLADDVLLWNVVPTHPGTPDSNRAPTAGEVRAGLGFASTLARGRRVIAVGRVAARALGARYVRHPSHGGADAFRLGLVGEVLGAQLGQRSGRLLEVQPHAVEDPLGLRELDVTVVDHLPVVAPRVAKVVVADHLRAGRSCRGQCGLPVVHDEADVAGAVGRLRATG